MNNIESAIQLTGDPRSRGVQHGKKLAYQIKGLLEDNCARINCHLLNPLSMEQICDYVRPYAIEIERELPSIAEEIKGLAEGAEIPYEYALLLQVRREVLMQISKGDNNDCSSFALPINTKTIAQTIDLNSSFSEFGTVFQIGRWKNTPEILMFSFAGLLGYMGMNSHGLSIVINMVSSGDWQLGVPPYLLVRHLLELSTIEACIDALANIRRSSSRSFTICDTNRCVTIEMTATNFVVLEGEKLFHTNHYLSSELGPKDTTNFLVRNSSMQRLLRLQELTGKLSSTPAIQEIFDLFADHQNYPVGLCSHANNDQRRTETVATVVMQPNIGAMYVRKGLPCAANKIEKYVLANQKIKDEIS